MKVNWTIVVISVISIVEILVTKKPPESALLFILYGIYKIIIDKF